MGWQLLPAQIFTASDIPLKLGKRQIDADVNQYLIITHDKNAAFKLLPSSAVDFSHNAMRRLAERLFDGMEDTLEEIYLRKGGMDTKIILVFK